VKAIVGAVVGVTIPGLLIVGIIFYRRWKSSRSQDRDPSMIHAPIISADRKLHIFISHTGGPDGSLKNFPIQLYEPLSKLPFFQVFIDRYELPKGTPFPEELKHEMQKIDMLGMGIGIMVITKEFFRKKWPMVELLEFLDMQNKHGHSKIRVLPLFYELKEKEIRSLLDKGFWEEEWANMSTENHPMDVGKCKDAVAKLCILNGVKYDYTDLGHNTEYIRDILECLNKMYNEMMTTSTSRVTRCWC
jgi:hypothetical protein